MSEISDGSFSLSNLGMFDISQFDAIINPPQVAILATSSIKPKPVAESGKVVIKQIMRVSLSLDHRAVDGAIAAQFLQSLKALLEKPSQRLQAGE